METPKFNIYSCDEFEFQGRYVDGNLFLHVESHEWKLSVLKKMYRIFGEFLNECKSKGIERFYTASPNSRFVKLFNGSSLGKVSKEGKEYEVFVWELK